MVLQKSVMSSVRRVIKSLIKRWVTTCDRWDLRPGYVKPYTVTTIDSDIDSRLRNPLKENYNPACPNSVWCSDIAYIPTDEGFCYLTSIMNLYSRCIIAWRISDTLEAKWVLSV